MKRFGSMIGACGLALCLVSCEASVSEVPAMTETERTIERLETQLGQAPNNIDVLISLGEAHLQAVRETADTSHYEEVLTLMDRVDGLEPRNATAGGQRAIVAAGYHHFADALDWAERALEISPGSPDMLAIRADALIELGRYDEAEAALQQLVDARPDFSSFARISYFRELNGDLKGAIDAMEMALQAGSSESEHVAWAHVQLGNLFLGKDQEEARRRFNWALHRIEEYPGALRGLGMIAFAEGDMESAENFIRAAYDAQPTAQTATDLADFYRSQGLTDDALRYETVAIAAYEWSEESGMDINLEYARFLADRDRDLSDALSRAREGYAARPGIAGADTLAWALHKSGLNDEAWEYATKALLTGSQDAAVSFHAAAIAHARGDSEQARRLLQRANLRDPFFSMLHADALRRLLEEAS